MLVIAKDTEEKLLQALQKCKDENPSQRCFYMAFSKTDCDRQKLFEDFLKLLQDVPSSYMAQVFICKDRDVFILMQGFMQRQFSDFLENLSQEMQAPDISDLGGVFEIGVNWSRLESLCQRKIEILAREQAKDREEQERHDIEKITADIFSKIDPNLVADIQTRRAQRDRPVVMIADDDQLARTLAGNVMREDYDLAFAKDGESALVEFVERAPDVLFLDIGMPDLSGHDVLESIFQIDPKAFVIMFSGRKDKENMMRAFEIGAQGFLGKPFTREQLYQHVEKSPFIMNKTGKRKDHERAVS